MTRCPTIYILASKPNGTLYIGVTSNLPKRAWEHTNLVARLNMRKMANAPEDKLLVYAQAVRGLIELEPSNEKRLKYLDFVDIYADLDDNEVSFTPNRTHKMQLSVFRFALG